MAIQFNYRNRNFSFNVALVKIHVPGIPHPLAFRPDTSDLSAFSQVFLDEDYPLNPAEPPQLIMDCGANVGYTSVLFANKFPSAQIFSVEPVRENFELLSENARPYPQIHPVHAAVWPRSTNVRIVSTDQQNQKLDFWGMRVEESDTPTPGQGFTRAMTIPELLESTGQRKIDILKIDIEGAEKYLFDSNAPGWLARTNMLAIEPHDRFEPGCTDAIMAAVKDLGFMMFQKHENLIFVRTKPIRD